MIIPMNVYICKFAMVILHWNYPMVTTDRLYWLIHMYIKNVVKIGGNNNHAYFSKRTGKLPYRVKKGLITEQFTYMVDRIGTCELNSCRSLKTYSQRCFKLQQEVEILLVLNFTHSVYPGPIADIDLTRSSRFLGTRWLLEGGGVLGQIANYCYHQSLLLMSSPIRP